jgi:hypothetical protein
VDALDPSSTAESELDRSVPCTAANGSMSFKTCCGQVSEAARQGLVLVIRGLSRPKRSIEWLNALMEMDVEGTTLNISSVKLSVHKDFRIIAIEVMSRRGVIVQGGAGRGKQAVLSFYPVNCFGLHAPRSLDHS